MKHIQGVQFLKQTNDRNWWLLTFSHQRCHTASCFAPSHMFTRKQVRALQQIPPALLSVAHPHFSPTEHRVSDSTRHKGTHQTLCLNYRCVSWQRALGSCCPLLTHSRHRALPRWLEGRRGSCQLFFSVHSTHGSNAHTGLPCFALPSAAIASSLLLPPRAHFNSRQTEPPMSSTQNSICFGQDGCQWSCGYPAAQAINPKRHSVKTFTCKLSLWTAICTSLQSKSTSHKHHSPVRVWKSLQPPGKKYYEENQRGELIEPAAVCSTYEMSQSSCCCTGFFLQGTSRREQCKNQNKMFTLLIHDYAFTPQETVVFCRTWHMNTVMHLLQKFFNSVYYNENIFPFFSFCLTFVTVENKGHHCIGVKHILLGFIW